VGRGFTDAEKRRVLQLQNGLTSESSPIEAPQKFSKSEMEEAGRAC